MRILLDSHALVWFITGNPRCSERAKSVIEEAGAGTLVSADRAFQLFGMRVVW